MDSFDQELIHPIGSNFYTLFFRGRSYNFAVALAAIIPFLRKYSFLI